MVELRRFSRAPLALSVEFTVDGGEGRFAGHARDISVGGMFVETTRAPDHNAKIVVHLTFAGQKAPFSLPAVVRWVNTDGMGLQFGLLGARETHAITEVIRTHEP